MQSHKSLNQYYCNASEKVKKGNGPVVKATNNKPEIWFCSLYWIINNKRWIQNLSKYDSAQDKDNILEHIKSENFM